MGVRGTTGEGTGGEDIGVEVAGVEGIGAKDACLEGASEDDGGVEDAREGDAGLSVGVEEIGVENEPCVGDEARGVFGEAIGVELALLPLCFGRLAGGERVRRSFGLDMIRRTSFLINSSCSMLWTCSSLFKSWISCCSRERIWFSSLKTAPRYSFKASIPNSVLLLP